MIDLYGGLKNAIAHPCSLSKINEYQFIWYRREIINSGYHVWCVDTVWFGWRYLWRVSDRHTFRLLKITKTVLHEVRVR